MPETTEYKDAKGKNRIRHRSDNGNITYGSTQGYENKKDMRDSAINASLELQKNYLDHMSQEQLQELYLLGEEARAKL